ncbi:MAG: hypothetical protein WC536_02225 [Patescibacteria group bacterium]
MDREEPRKIKAILASIPKKEKCQPWGRALTGHITVWLKNNDSNPVQLISHMASLRAGVYCVTLSFRSDSNKFDDYQKDTEANRSKHRPVIMACFRAYMDQNKSTDLSREKAIDLLEGLDGLIGRLNQQFTQNLAN